MNLPAKEFVDHLLSKESAEDPTDKVKLEELVMELPEDFDEKKFNRGREFYQEFAYSLSSSMLLGLMAVLSVPSILRVLVSSHRSSSVYTAYKRYVSTLLHTVSWFEHELKPGSTSWKSLYTVRSRHLRASMASKLKGTGIVSKKDIAITQFGFIGFSVLKPDKFGIRQLKEGDWDAYIYTWRVIGQMLGLEDKYNLCRRNFYETRAVCQELQDRVFTPCLENVPEYFEHMNRVMLEGFLCVNPTIDVDAFLYFCRQLSDVPGYIYTEQDRTQFQVKLRKSLANKPINTGVDTMDLMHPTTIEGLPKRPPKFLYYKDFESIETVPAYKELGFKSRYKLFMVHLYSFLYSSYLGRLFFNFQFKLSLFLMRYFPYLAFFKFGVKKSFVNIFEEDPSDDTKPKPNEEYYKPKKPDSFLSILWSFIW